MTTMTLPQMNGSTADSQSWLRQSVQQFFEACNWEGRSAPPQLQIPLPSDDREEVPSLPITLDFTLSVSQFFGAISWDGTPIIAAPLVADASGVEGSISQEDDFTLDDFSGLFG